jgi:hypothetical protein
MDHRLGNLSANFYQLETSDSLALMSCVHRVMTRDVGVVSSHLPNVKWKMLLLRFNRHTLTLFRV